MASNSRLNFIDIDEGLSFVETDTTIKGYMVCRSKKGTSEAMYIPPNNEAMIHSMFGLPTADYPDLVEAVAFNKEYGLYISAPAGTNEEYPSTYGGSYLTKYGLFDFENVTDKDNPNFIVKIGVGNESLVGEQVLDSDKLSIVSLSTYDSSNRAVQGGIKFKCSPKIFASANTFDFNFWGVEGGADKGVYTYQIENGEVFCLTKQGTKVTDTNDTPVVCGYLKEDFIYLGDCSKASDSSGASIGASSNTLNHNLIPFIVFDKFAYGYKEAVTDVDATIPNEDIKKCLITGKKVSKGDKTIHQPLSTLTNTLTWNFDIKKDSYMYFVQKSPSETPTNINITKIGYDKYKYDHSLQYFIGEYTDKDSATIGITDEDALKYTSTNADSLFAKVTIRENYKGFTEIEDESELQEVLEKSYYVSILKKVFDYKNNQYYFEDVSSDYRTQTIKLTDLLLRDEEVDTTFTNTIWDIENLETINNVTKHTATFVAEPAKDVTFNTITFNISEEVKPGVQTSGGDFHGSLSETGKDSYGSNIFLTNILPEDALSFIEVKVLRTFDKEATSGFFTGIKLVNNVGAGAKVHNFDISGTRFMTKLVDDNIEAGMVGSAWTNDFFDGLAEGWAEALKPKYDDCSLFMECTGQELFKPTLVGIRKEHFLATVISPKIITQAEFLAPNTIVVSGRAVGTAQIVGEFLVIDPYTSRKYWCMPIGDVGVNLARIMDLKLGGYAPMFKNATGGLGGQLARPVLKAKYDFGSEFLSIMDKKKGIIPITYTADDGLMMTSQKSTKDPAEETDWSFLGHSMSFDLCKREIRDTVMKPQIGKRNNTKWQEIREKDLIIILDKRVSGASAIWDSYSINIKNANTDAVKRARKFVIKVKVKVSVYSESVDLEFTNVGQETVLN